MSTINRYPDNNNDTDNECPCPICLEPFPVAHRSWGLTPCCGNKICMECHHKMRKYNRNETVRRMDVQGVHVSAQLQQGGEQGLELVDSYCPLCRCPVPKSMKDEFKLVSKRAKNGCTWAQCMVGLMYMKGKGVKKNEVEYARWIKKAAEAGNTDAMNAYAECNRMGHGVPTSLIDAEFWYEKAADAGDTLAKYSLGRILLSGGHLPGEGLPADPVEFRIRADQGHDNAQCSLGDCFATGNGVEKNIEQALHWYGKAISQGNDRAMHNYAVVLLQNAEEKYGTIRLVGKSPIPQALYWHRKAAAGGHEKAVAAVADLEQQVSKKCAKCDTAKVSCKELLKCKKCEAAYYCGRSCQVEHWQMGHKTDCCWKKNMLDHGSKTEGNDMVTTTVAQDVTTALQS